VKPAPHIPDEVDIHPEEARARSRIRKRRRELDFTLTDVAFMTGISESRLKRMEAGDPKGRKPSLRAVLLLAMALKCDTVDQVIEDWFWPEPPRPPDPDWLIRHGQYE
jgi:transcriptional regulator with XRE-family HTH domain